MVRACKRSRLFSFFGIVELLALGAVAGALFMLVKSPTLFNKIGPTLFNKIGIKIDPVLTLQLFCGIAGGIVVVMALTSVIVSGYKHEKAVKEKNPRYWSKARAQFAGHISLGLIAKTAGIASGFFLMMGCLTLFVPGVAQDMDLSKQTSIIMMAAGIAVAVFVAFAVTQIILTAAELGQIPETQFKYAALSMATSGPITAIVSAAACTFAGEKSGKPYVV